jgi:hypothetical protein
MALPASEENKELISSVSEMKGIVSGLLFQINDNTLAAKESLAAIKIQQAQMAQGIGDLVAKAELDFEQMQDIGQAIKEPVQSEVVDATPELDQEVLDEIKDATKETADATTAIAASMSESSEDVLQATPEPPTVDTDTTPTPTDASPDKAKTGGGGAIAVMLGAILGTIGGIVSGWAKALNLILMGVPKRLATIFTNFLSKVKGLFSFKGNSGLSKGITKIKGFFTKIGNFFKGFGKKINLFGNIFKTITSTAAKVAAVVSKVFFPLTVLLSIFETLRGAISGFTENEGSMADKIFAGLKGAYTGLLDFLIAAPLNLVKDLIGWIAGILGFEGVKEKLDGFDFSFGGIVDMMVDALRMVADVARRIILFPTALAAGIGAALGALLPGGKSPKEAFKATFDKVMSTGSSITQESEESKNSGKDLAGKTPDGESISSNDAVPEGSVPSDGSDGEDVVAVKIPADDSTFPRKLRGTTVTVLEENRRGRYAINNEDGKRVLLSKKASKSLVGLLNPETSTGDGDLTSSGSNSGSTISGQTADADNAKLASLFTGGGGSTTLSTINAPSSIQSMNKTTVIQGQKSSLENRMGQLIPN